MSSRSRKTLVLPGHYALAAVAMITTLLMPVSRTSSRVMAQSGSDLESPTAEIKDTRDFLELMGVSESQLGFVEDGLPFEEHAGETLGSLLRIVTRLPRSKLQHWIVRDWTWEELIQRPGQFRGHLITVMGRIRTLRRYTLPIPVSQPQGFDHYFIASISRLATPDNRVTVVLRRVPATFAIALDKCTAAGEPSLQLDERVRLSGIYYQSIAGPDASNDLPGVVLVGDALEWFPDDPESRLLNGKTQFIELANLGVDIGTFDAVSDRRGLSAEESDCFYQMLAAVGRPTNQRLQQLATSADAIALLKDPQAHRGRFFTYRGTARRAIKIIVDDPIVQETLGITHYFELEVFDAQATVHVKRANDDPAPVEFKTYPVVFCTRELPAGMATGDFIHENVEITGAYFKLWAYRTQFMDTAARSDRATAGHRTPLQMSPLLIGKKPLLIQSTADKPQAGWLVGIGFSFMLLLLWLVMWWTSRGDRRYRQTMISRHADSSDGDGLSQLD